MSWASVGDFNTLIAPGVRTNCLASFGGLLYVGLSNGGIWHYDGVNWEQSGSSGSLTDEEVSTLLPYDGELYAGFYGSGDDSSLIFKLNNSTGEWEVELSANSESIVQLVEFGGDLYCVTTYRIWLDEDEFHLFQGKVYRKSGGSWVELTTNEDYSYTLGTFDATLYLSTRTGTVTDGTNYIEQYGGATIFSEAVGGTVIFKDLFDDTPGTLVTDHTPDIGGAWVSLLNNAEVNGKLHSISTDPFLVVTDTGESDGVIICHIEPGNDSNNMQGIATRVQDIDNLWYFVYSEGGLSSEGDSIYIIERNGGINTIRASMIISLSSTFGADYYFRVELSGNDMDFMILDAGETTTEHVKLSYTSSFLATETLHGIVVGASLFDTQIASFNFIEGYINTWHCQARRMLEFGLDFYAYDARYVHRWVGGASWVLDHTFDFDEVSQWGRRDLIEYDSKLWAGVGTSIWVRDGGVWSEDPDSDIGYSSEAIATNMYNPPIGFAEYNGSLYVCGGPGEVFIRQGTTFNVKGIGISKSKGNDEKLYVTLWRPDELVLRVYDTSVNPPVAELEESLGLATLAQVNAGVLTAYPHAPREGSNGRCFVYGRFDAGLTHVMRTNNAGVSFVVIEDTWGADVCGALFTRHGKVYAVRNKSTISYLYSGFNELTYLNTLPFPVNPFAFKLSPTFKAIFVGNNVGGNSPRIIGLSYPFSGNYSDLTANYPTAGEVNAIVPL